ncbi:MAG TPA: amidohydrolase family protein [Candidatus Brocadiaceae bacterium]|nr:amidohydrolase family protein [Candidatus Brocadiaceae bacterium]
MIIIRAKYLIPTPGSCIENGAVAVTGAKIHRVGLWCEMSAIPGVEKVIDLGNAVIMPGLINTHTHLDLSNLHNRIKPTSNFTHWVFQVIGARMRWKDEDYVFSIEKGAKLSIESGVTTVADISNTGHAFSVLKKSPLRKVVYKEIIGIKPEQAADIMKKLKEELPQIKTDALLSVGLSPHAPYSVSRELYQAACGFAGESRLPVCTHLAETQDEIEFLTKGTGNFPAFLRQIRALPDGWKPPGTTPVRYLSEMGVINNRTLLIHCNYVSDEEIALIQSSGASVAFCPGSHCFFGHTNHPVRRFLDAGINVGIGTDSLASNDSLSVLDELKYLSTNLALSPQTLISMATVNGAKAIGLESRVGQLREGFESDICGVGLPEQPAEASTASGNEAVYQRLFSPTSKNVFTMVAGVVCYNTAT